MNRKYNRKLERRACRRFLKQCGIEGVKIIGCYGFCLMVKKGNKNGGK